MKWQTLIERVATRAEAPRQTTRSVLDALRTEIEERLSAGESVTLPGVGTLTSQWIEPRTLRSIRDGRKVAIDGRYRATFRPATQLRATLRDRTPQTLLDPAHQRAWRLAETLVSDVALYHESATPQGVYASTELVEVDARCAQAFGLAWARARRTLDAQTPPEVRAARDHLAIAARRRWATVE
ncbi:MAG: HU family DNA-binding protein [Myxococcota bacterium]